LNLRILGISLQRGLFLCLALFIFASCDRARPVLGHVALGSSAEQWTHSGYSVQWYSLDRQRHQVLDEVFMSLSLNAKAADESEKLLLLLAALEPGDPTAMSRLALMRLRFRASTANFREVFEITKRLSVEAPNHPDRLFLEGYVRWFALRGGIGTNSAELAEQSRKGLVASWEKLLEQSPQFKGPMGFDAERIRGELASLTQGAGKTQ